MRSADRINQVMDIIESNINNGEKLTVVVSALGGITDLLLNMASTAAKGKNDYQDLYAEFRHRHNEAAQILLGENYTEYTALLNENHDTLKSLLEGIFLVREVSPRTKDYVVSFGERNSAFLISKALQQRGLKAEYLDARKIIITDKNFTKANVHFDITNDRIQKYYAENSDHTHIVTGFVSADVGGLTTTLGRGGSDYTAAILAGALSASVLEIWTDVDGVLTCDPRKVKKAFTLPELSYKEAMEMSHFGAKVIYPPTIQPALKAGIPIYIKNTFNPGFVGTLIHDKSQDDFRSPIKGISSLKDIAMITLEGGGLMGTPGIAARMFSSLSQQEISVVLITQASSEHSITFAVQAKDAKKAKEIISQEFSSEIERGIIEPVSVLHDLVIMAVIGEQMKSVPGIAGKLFQSLGQNGINIIAIAQGSSELNISFIVHKDQEHKALNLIHDSFFLSDLKRVNVFSVGVGLIGGTLLDQIKDQNEELKKELLLEINMAGVSNSKQMLFDQEGIALDTWKERLSAEGVSADIDGFVAKMIELNLPNSVFIDNTASKKVPDYYKQILGANISVVTPNKVATSSSYENYVDLKETAKSKGVKFLYETNVGAGLPVISTIKALTNSGDKIRKIEAVVSGSLSYIFNNFTGDETFAQLVTKAKELGYTEPDPREDLSGMDVSRKIIILTRESGIVIEPSDVTLNPILPQKCMDADTVEDFLQTLVDENDYFNNLVETAKSKGEVLRFIATMENGKASVGMKSVGPDSPFYSLKGSDNMIAITTDRYSDRPLIVRGPGAGAEVTAGGVFADILSIGS